MKKEFLLLGPLFLLTGCGGLFKKEAPHRTQHTYENETEVYTEFDNLEGDGSVRSFFDDTDNDYYAQTDFEASTNTFVTMGHSYDDTTLSVSAEELEQEDNRIALDMDYEVEDIPDL